jgi:hypothetical protein
LSGYANVSSRTEKPGKKQPSLAWASWIRNAANRRTTSRLDLVTVQDRSLQNALLG